MHFNQNLPFLRYRRRNIFFKFQNFRSTVSIYLYCFHIFYYTLNSNNHKWSYFSFKSFSLFAFFRVTIFLPVFDSISFLALPATVPPPLATFLFSGKFLGCLFCEISVVAVSASIFKTSSRLVILSRKFSFFKSFRFLYCLVVNPAHALDISLVKMANSNPSFAPRFSHSSVRAFLISMLFSR